VFKPRRNFQLSSVRIQDEASEELWVSSCLPLSSVTWSSSPRAHWAVKPGEEDLYVSRVICEICLGAVNQRRAILSETSGASWEQTRLYIYLPFSLDNKNPLASGFRLQGETVTIGRGVHRHFGGQVLKPPKKGTHRPKHVLTELKQKQHYTSEAVLDLRLLWAGLDG